MLGGGGGGDCAGYEVVERLDRELNAPGTGIWEADRKGGQQAAASIREAREWSVVEKVVCGVVVVEAIWRMVVDPIVGHRWGTSGAPS
jgi:hypothetical protein